MNELFVRTKIKKELLASSGFDLSGFLADSTTRTEACSQTITTTFFNVVFSSNVTSEVFMDQTGATNIGHKQETATLTTTTLFVDSFVVLAVCDTGEEACDEA